jgi:hypothetical protein
MVTSKRTNKHLSWYIGIVVAKLPFGLKFFFFFGTNLRHLVTKRKSGANKLKEIEL